ncbi:MAG TPA: CHAD domain-containing protein [Vicinamibacterales bacterium]|nr:CHAD domain-containing protein [Vicinamibacterales bacterium]
MSTVSLSEILKPHVDRFTRAVRGMAKGDVHALHRARVESRRLRELIPVLPLDADVARKLNRRLRKVTARLGTVRELDVLLHLIDELHEARRPHSDPLARVAVAVARRRDKARERLLDRMPIDELERHARKLRNLIDEIKTASPRQVKAARWAIDARIARRASRLDHALLEAGAVYLPERLHAVRIAVKKLRYSLELAAATGDARHESTVRTLRRAQDALGRMHDLQVLIDRVRDVQATLTPPSVTMWRSLDALVRSLDEDCRRLHGRFMRVVPELETIARRAEPATRNAPSRTRKAG